MTLLPGDTGYLWNPLPLEAMGFIAMQVICEFKPDNNTFNVSADGNFLKLTKGGQIYLLSQGGKYIPLPKNSGFKSGFISPDWVLNKNRMQIMAVENYPANFNWPKTNFDTGNFNGGPRIYTCDLEGSILGEQWSIPGDALQGHSLDAEAWGDKSPFDSQAGATDGAMYFGSACWKCDDFNGQQNGVYWSVPSGMYLSTMPYFNNSIYVPVDPSKPITPSFNVYLNAFDESTYCSFQAGQVWGPNYNSNFQNNQGAYADNFPGAPGAGGGFVSGVIGMCGLNCTNLAFYDNATNRIFPNRMAQDQYLVTLARTNGGTSSPGAPNYIPTRFRNSATYAQSIWQPGIAITAPLNQYGVTVLYPELQLSGVSVFGSDGVNHYYYVLPQDFVKLSIVESPDLLWVSPTGAVLGVYHDTHGNYYFMAGGNRSTYQSGTSNYRQPYKV